MDINFIDTIRNSFEDFVIRANSASVQRAEFGFINRDCDFVKTMLGNICFHAIYNPDIFNETQLKNIGNIINMLAYE